MIGSVDHGLLKGLSQATEIISGTSPGGNTVNTFVLDSNASSIDGTYDPAIIVIYDGTGKGQSRQVWDYVGSTKTCILNRDWKFTPDETSKYKILYNAGNTHVNEGMAQAGGASTITLNALASTQNNIYLGQIIFITSGTGQDQARMVVAYNGTTKIATVDSPWITQPNNTSVYAIYPFPGFVHGRPAANSTDNILIRDVIGNKNDFIQVPYVPGENSISGHGNTLYYHFHGYNFMSPYHANPVTLTSSAASWSNTGTIATIIAANSITKAFDLHYASISSISAELFGIIDLYIDTGSGWEFFRPGCDVQRTSNFAREGVAPLQVAQIPANAAIGARFLDSTTSSRTLGLRVYGHVYGDTL